MIGNKGLGWLAVFWRFSAGLKQLALNALFGRKNPAPAIISPGQQEKYLVFMMDPAHAGGQPVGPAGPVQAGSAENQPANQSAAENQPANQPANQSAVESAGNQAAARRESGWWRALGILCAIAFLMLALAVLWYYPSTMASLVGSATDTARERWAGYGITPVMAKAYSSPSFQEDGHRRRLRKVETARGYLRGAHIAPFLKKAQRNWRSKLYNAQVSKALSVDKHDLTMTLPYENLTIVPNAAGGDCLFLCWERMLRAVGVHEDTASLRRVVADSLTQEKFDFLKGVFDSAVKEADSELVSDYAFMHGLRSLEDLRAMVMQSSYYGDEMALSALEQKFDIRCVVLLLVNNARISLARRFAGEESAKSRYGILLLDQSMLHYELVEYFDQAVMTPDELPEKVQLLLGDMARENTTRA